MKNRFKAVFIILILAIFSHPVFAEDKVQIKKILMIYSSSPETLEGIKFSKALKDQLNSQNGFEIDYMFEYNDFSQNIDKKNYLNTLTRFLKEKYQYNKPDLVVHQLRNYDGRKYSNYFLKYQEIFPNVPVLLTGANELEDFAKLNLPFNYTGVFSKMDLSPSFNLILKTQPLTKKIYLVIGTSDLEMRLLDKTLKEIKGYDNKVRIEVLNKQPVSDILKTISHAEKNSVVLLPSFIQDIDKKIRFPDDIITQLTNVSPVPIYGNYIEFVENGAVGGAVYSDEIFGKRTAELCIYMLNNPKIVNIPLKIVTTTSYLFDFKKVKAFGIKEDLLPEESIVVNIEYSFWELYYVYIIAIVGFIIVESFLIVYLVINRSYRKKAEKQILKINDLLEHKVLERTEQLELINEDLLKSKNLAEIANKTKSEFLANMSHELRTPLNAIIGFSELLRTVIKDSKYRSYIETINLAGNSLLILINDILDLSKIESGKLEIKYKPVDLNKTFDEIGKIFKQKFESKNIKFILDISNDFPKYILIDEIRIRQILLNLVGNAIKFTDQGYIKISSSCTYYDSNDFSKFNILMSVEDTGIGIPEEDQSLIFESFRQKSGQDERKYGGTGLGLSITKKLVGMMNGNIYIESVPDKGSTFFVEFFDLNKPALDILPKEETLFDFTNYSFDSQNILIVDDIESNRLLLKELLIKVGLNVITVENGFEAVKIANDLKPDLIIMDLVMPVMNGYEAAKKIKDSEYTSQVPVMALTASIAENSFSDSNFDAFLTKPVVFEKLLNEITKFIPNKIITTKEAIIEIDKKIEIDSSLLQYFIENLKPIIDKLEKALTIDKVNQVANALISKGKEYNSEVIVLKGEELLGNALSFDIIKIKKNLKDISKLMLEGNKNGR